MAPATMAFAQPCKPFEVPTIWEAALAMLRDGLDRVVWNVTQQEAPAFFGSGGARFECAAFCVEGYSWDEDTHQPWNFRWGTVEISWYKNLGRGMSANCQLDAHSAEAMLLECLEAVDAYGKSAGMAARHLGIGALPVVPEVPGATTRAQMDDVARCALGIYLDAQRRVDAGFQPVETPVSWLFLTQLGSSLKAVFPGHSMLQP